MIAHQNQRVDQSRRQCPVAAAVSLERELPLSALNFACERVLAPFRTTQSSLGAAQSGRDAPSVSLESKSFLDRANSVCTYVGVASGLACAAAVAGFCVAGLGGTAGCLLAGLIKPAAGLAVWHAAEGVIQACSAGILYSIYTGAAAVVAQLGCAKLMDRRG